MDYIICNHKKSKPKVSVELCEKCKRIGTCADYARYTQPSLFPDSVMGTNRIKIKPLKIKPEPTEILDRPEQLALDIQKKRQ
jgi:hypothetical protein